MAFNGYTMNKYQDPSKNFAIAFNDVKVQKALAKDAVSSFFLSKKKKKLYFKKSWYHCAVRIA